MFFDKNLNPKKEIFHFYFNTAFIEENRLVLPKPEIDIAWKDRKCKKFMDDFEVRLKFKGAKVSTMAKIQKGEVREGISIHIYIIYIDIDRLIVRFLS